MNIWSFIIPVLAIVITTIPNTAEAFDYYTNCTGSSNYTGNSPYKTNLRILLSSIASNAPNSGFYNSSIGNPPNQAYALYLCRADVDSRRCSECVYQAYQNILQQCPTQLWAVLWFDNCMLRFSNSPLYKTLDVTHSIAAWVGEDVPTNQTHVFAHVLNSTVAGLVNPVGVSPGRFATNEANVSDSEKLYTLGQCTPDLSTDECERCLRVAVGQMIRIPYLQIGGRILQPSCNIRYDVDKFYGTANFTFLLAAANTKSSPVVIPTQKEKKRRSSHLVVAVTIPIVVAVLVLSIICYRCRYRYGYRKSQDHSRDLEEITTPESLQFDFKTIRIATDNFSMDNKLGEGGFGGVYKGRLSNGQEIAVKRLSTNSGQGINEFKAEAVLVARLQHKNLVKLLGFCLHKDEKLLIYEFLPNSSLDKVLLDDSRDESLDWETRYKIITGIAKGLSYLHEDSRLKVIHRDLKSSNILLDESMNPKISDFGLAKLVGTNQTQANTNRIVGTYGYMAPEYAMTGRYSIKSDVYSFGVIVMEIICGHKCNSTASPFDEESMTQRAWRLWNDDKTLEMVDPRLGSDFSSDELVKCVHIGLLCVQEDAKTRPTITSIVSALNGHYVDFPAPSPPQLVISHGYGFSSQSYSETSGNQTSSIEL